MPYNGYRVKTNTELSAYQKKIESIENVILCVAEAEKLVASVGKETALPGDVSYREPEELPIGCEFPWDVAGDDPSKSDG